MNLQDIKEHWQRSASAFGSLADEATSTPTSRDPYLGLQERRNIEAHLARSDVALEVGCGDASHTVHYAPLVRTIDALDVADALIDLARRRITSSGLSNARLHAASVLDVSKLFAASSFDVVISQRCLVNLPEWDLQREALEQISAVLRPGGRLLMTEGFEEELANINEVRTRVGLAAIRTASYNRNLRHAEFDSFIARDFRIEAVRDYGAYLFLSRVFHPLVVAPEEPRHDSQLNEAAMLVSPTLDMEGFRRFSYNMFYVLRRR